eukprot:45375-Amphidinium_carterae.1
MEEPADPALNQDPCTPMAWTRGFFVNDICSADFVIRESADSAGVRAHDSRNPNTSKTKPKQNHD